MRHKFLEYFMAISGHTNFLPLNSNHYAQGNNILNTLYIPQTYYYIKTNKLHRQIT